MGYLCEGHEVLCEDEGSEADGFDFEEDVADEDQGEHHDDGSLVDGFPHPGEEGLGVEVSALLEGAVERGEHECGSVVDVLVEDDAEDREHAR